MPIVAAVATLEPEVAANRAQAPMLECIRPPGSQESHCRIESYIPVAIPERNRISPSRINNGMATRVYSVPVDHITIPMALESGIGE